MATALPLSDRRARLALALALLGLPSIGVTLPAAVWLGARALRQRSLASGSEPVMGFLALVIAGIDLLFIHMALVRLFESIPADTALPAIAWGAGLAAFVMLLSLRSLSIHPERWGALLVTRAAILAALAGAAALFVGLLTTIQG
jgi:hypothetical protein